MVKDVVTVPSTATENLMASAYESCLHHLAQDIDDVLFFLDAQRRWRFVNPAWTRRTGYTQAETLDNAFADYLHPSEREQIARWISDQTGQDAVRPEKVRIRTKTNGYRPFRLHLVHLLTPNGVAAGSCGLLIDLSRRRRRNANPPELPDEPPARALIQEILDHLSHDFRTPLSVVSSYLFLARRQAQEGSQLASYLDIASGQADRLALLLDEITVFANLESEREAYTFDRVSLNEVLNEVMLQQAPATRAKRLGLQAIFAADPPDIRGDRIWLVHLANHLVANSIQNTAANGEVRVATIVTPTHIILEVADTGVGIAEAELEQIFNQFYRSERHRPASGGGAGLGLAIVKKIVDAHNGKISVESAVGKGTTVQIRFPHVGPL